MAHIFISYSHKDSDYVQRLQAALQQRGFEIWVDDRIDHGVQWPRVIQEHLDVSDAFILVLSENSYSSAWVQDETARARRKQIPILPLLLSGELWLSVESIQCEDVTGGLLPSARFFDDLRKHIQPGSQPQPGAPAPPAGQRRTQPERREFQRRKTDPGAATKWDSDKYYSRGQAFWYQGNYAGALQAYTRAIELYADNPSFYGQRSLVYDRLGMPAEAEADRRKYAALLGHTPVDQEKYEDLLAAGSEQVPPPAAPEEAQPEPTDAQGFLRRGDAQARQAGNLPAALADYTRALELDPGIAKAYRSRSQVYQQLGLHAEAKADLVHYFKLIRKQE